MSQKNAAELCSIILKEIYGEVSSKVASVLLEYGRLTLPSLVRYSNLPEKIVKQTLVVLIQLHLVVHYAHKEGYRDEVYYECAWKKIYELLHAGKMIALAKERFGNDGAYVISHMLQMGHVRVSDFLTGSGLSNQPKGTAVTNGLGNGDMDAAPVAPATLASLKAVMGDLLRSRYIIPVQEHHMHPETDVINNIRLKLTKQVKESQGSISDLKLKKLVDAQMKDKLREIALGDLSEHAGMKKRMVDIESGDSKRPSKRARLASSFDDVSGKEAVWEIDENIIVRVNHEKFLVLFRNRELVALAERRLGKTPSLVYGELLKCMEDKIYGCQDAVDDEDDSDSKKKIKISTLELSRTFDKDIELEGTIAPLPKSVNGKKRRLDEDDNGNDLNVKANGKYGRDLNDDEDDEDDDEDEWNEDQEVNPETAAKKKRMAIMKMHLDLLAQDSYHFVKAEGTRGLGEWNVDFTGLTKIMKQIEMEKIIEQKFGPVATRLLRILHEKGKLDEKQLAAIALRKSTSIRSTLSQLQEAGHLELQEVPKTADRAASRTIFLWYYDSDRARLNVLHDIYKALARTLQRIAHERSEVLPLLEKAERTDIQGKEELYLSKGERRTIARFRIMEEKLLAQALRLDRQVLIFRDY